MSESQETWIGQIIGGRYQIESLLGRGGMSSVYKGLDPNLQRPVAIKLIHRHLSEREEWVKRFEQEASAVAQLRHPNIIQVYDFNKSGSTYYMVMEYVAGQTLDKKLMALNSAKIRLPIHSVLNIMMTLCDAVGYAHGQQIIHRDLKPSNIVMNLLDQPMLMDFGIAKMVGSDMVQTATGTTMGTAAYMAPEQITGQDVDHRADLYALGVILYELLNGTPPYQGKSPLTVMMKHVNEALPDIRLRHSGLPETIVAILEKALQKNPDDRFQSAAEMAMALRMLAGSTGFGFTGYGTSPGMSSTLAPMSQTNLRPPTPEQTSPPDTDSTQGGYKKTIVGRSIEPPPPTLKKPAVKRIIPVLPLAIGGGVVVLILLAYFLLPRLLQPTPPATGMAHIPSGSYTVGSGNGGSQSAPSQTVDLDEFWIDRYEITNAQYATFVAETGSSAPANWPSGGVPLGQDNNPVQGTTWEMAADYCDWADKRLPTEAEWEAAARGSKSWLYPWGNDAVVVQLVSTSSYPVGGVPANRSSFDVYDMAGNVWEWVDDPYGPVGNSEKVLRGGAYDFQKNMTYRLVGNPNVPTMFATAGFRCAASKVETGAEENRVLLQDDFTNPESGWPETTTASALQGYHPPDYYHVQASVPNQIATAYFGGNYDNIAMEAQVFVDSIGTPDGNFRYGLMVRRVDERFYAFAVSPHAGQWFVLKGTPAGLETLSEGSVADLHGINTGADNSDKLRIDAAGSNLTFTINDQVVTQLDDFDYRSGDIGFYVETFDQGLAHVHYDSLEVDKLDAVPVVQQLLLTDDFTNPESGWPDEKTDDTLSGYHPPDYYHVQSARPNHTATAFFNKSFSDFTMEADVFVDNTDTETGDFYYGLAVYQNGSSYYGLLVSPRAGRWEVVEQGSEGQKVLAEGEEGGLHGLSGADKLRVDAAGSNVIFGINGRSVAQLEGVATTSGQIGFVVETLDESRAHIHYDSLTVRPVERNAVDLPTAVSVASTTTTAAEPTPIPTPAPAPTAAPLSNIDLPVNIGMTRVLSSTYTVGNNITVKVPEFWIDRYEVTNAQFAAFVDETGQAAPAYWEAENIPASNGDHPVHGVTWDVANAYCNWANKRLPSEAEWEVAARGPQGWLYPWGNQRNSVLLPNQGTYAVGTLPANRSFFGAFDMAGNVWEWVGDPYIAGNAGERVIRGGANVFQNDMLARLSGDPGSQLMFKDTGLRCAADRVLAETDPSVLLDDEFADINSGWFQASGPIDAYFYGYHPTDFYHVQVTAPDDCLTVRNDLSVENFMIEARIFKAATNTDTGLYRNGFVLRETSNNTFYAFTLTPRSQTWQVVKGTEGGMVVLREGTSAAIRGDSQATEDRLFAIANGSEMTFFVNGELVAQVVDSDYGQGDIGLIVETLDETFAHIHYDAVTVWKLPEGVVAGGGDVTAPTETINPLCRGTVSDENLLLNFITYSVVQGDTLSSIAARFGLPLDDILGANGRTVDNPRFISVGQTIIIPQT